MNKKKKQPKYLYHHTSLEHWEIIKQFGYLALTESNILPPDRATEHIIELKDKEGKVYGMAYQNKNSNYKPVVWLTTQEIPEASSLGLNGSTVDKTAVTIVFPYQNRFVKWRDFANANKMDSRWRFAFESGRKPNTWYICRTPINLSDAIEIRINNHTKKAV